MKKAQDSLTEAIQSSGYKAALVVTGGGSGAVESLLSHPGASRFILEVQIPYSAPAMRDYLGEELDSHCSEYAAVVMAERAYERAYIFTLPFGDESPILGIACTAALQTNRERQGADRAFICLRARNKQETRKLELVAGTRAEQEDAVSTALLDFVADFVGVTEE